MKNRNKGTLGYVYETLDYWQLWCFVQGNCIHYNLNQEKNSLIAACHHRESHATLVMLSYIYIVADKYIITKPKI